MDRRQKKSRKAIFGAFIDLLSQKSYTSITVGEIITTADVGRATFYSHFETKDFLLKELCEDLFCHVFDETSGNYGKHEHIFSCDAPSSVFLHLFKHLQNNDNNILRLFSSSNNEIFMRYFKENLKILVKSQIKLFENDKPACISEEFWLNHVCSTFVETVTWWVENGRKEDAETLSNYFIAVLQR